MKLIRYILWRADGTMTTNVLAIPAGKKGVYFFDVSSTETNVFNGLTQ